MISRIAKRLVLPGFLALGIACSQLASGQTESGITQGFPVEIRSVTVNEKPVALRRKEVSLGPFPEQTAFFFGRDTNSPGPACRVRYKLEGFDNNWQDGPGEMFLAVRFYNAAGDQIMQHDFKARGESAGWNDSLRTSSLTHRRETVIVPPQAARVWIVISSAGPPATVGVYVVANLVVSKTAANGPPIVLLESPLDRQLAEETNRAPTGWTPDGNHSSMAKVVTVGQDPAQKAFAILDDDGKSHAEWHNIMASAPMVQVGEPLLVEWNEMFSMGVVDITAARYAKLPEGKYRFHTASFNIFGQPTGPVTSIAVIVPPPVWRTPWFWSVIVTSLLIIVFGGVRYVVWHRMRREMARLKSQQALEQERLRIARDIHDDLGTRVTEISLASALAKGKTTFPASASADFDNISCMCRDLVSALYETVWAVNPENDNLEALGNFLCQSINQLCEQAQLPCRFQVSDLPRDFQVSSQTRHNIVMAVKEAVHNIIKHARATEISLHVAFERGDLTISIQDDGCGIRADGNSPGHGLNNMKQRLENLGGHCSIESHTAGGTIVKMQVALRSTP